MFLAIRLHSSGKGYFLVKISTTQLTGFPQVNIIPVLDT